MKAVTTYLNDFVRKFGDGWNRFWYTPVDPFPAAVLRIGIGLAAFYLIALFSFDLLQFFGPHGLLPIESVRAIYPENYRLTYFESVQDVATLRLMHYAGLAILAANVVGLWSRVTSVLALIVFMSYFHRAPMLTSVAEPVIAMSLFYLCFAPTGAYLSVDAWLRRRREAKIAHAAQEAGDSRNINAVKKVRAAAASNAPLQGRSFAAAVSLRLLQTHFALIYFLMFLATMQRNEVWWNGKAVWWLMARTESAMIDMRWLANYPYAIHAWTTAIVLFYIAFAILIWNRTARPLLIALSAPFWIGIALISGLGPFCWAMFVGGLSFVSAEQWRGLCCSKSAPAGATVVPSAKGA